MASILDVENAIVDIIAPSKPVGYEVHYFPGFPYPEDLERNLAQSIHQVSVFPANSGQRLTPNLNPEEDIIDEGDTYTVIKEVSRQRKNFQVVVHTNSFEAREVVSEAIKVALDEISTIDFDDGSSGSIIGVSEAEDDHNQKEAVYRRILIYAVEYSTVKQETVYKACLPQILNLNDEVVEVGSETSVLVDEIT